MKLAYSKGRTINTGNFNSVRIDVSLEIECSDDDQEAAFDRIKTWVNTKLATEKGE